MGSKKRRFKRRMREKKAPSQAIAFATLPTTRRWSRGSEAPDDDDDDVDDVEVEVVEDAEAGAKLDRR